jgi:predicted enzyme related to lactoylglutathione lyase
MAHIIGLGGVFIKYKNPKDMTKWYSEVLGITTNDYGVLFEFGGENTRKGYLQLSPFESNSDYFGKPEQKAMLNFRVDDLIEFSKLLKTKNVILVDEIETYSYGKFLHIEDPEGNRIQLWEPVDKVFEEGKEAVTLMR